MDGVEERESNGIALEGEKLLQRKDPLEDETTLMLREKLFRKAFQLEAVDLVLDDLRKHRQPCRRRGRQDGG